MMKILNNEYSLFKMTSLVFELLLQSSPVVFRIESTEQSRWVEQSEYIQTVFQCDDLQVDFTVKLSEWPIETFLFVRQLVLADQPLPFPRWLDISSVRNLLGYLGINSPWLKVPLDNQFMSLLNPIDKTVLIDDLNLTDESIEWDKQLVDFKLLLKSNTLDTTCVEVSTLLTNKHKTLSMGNYMMIGIGAIFTLTSKEIIQQLNKDLRLKGIDWTNLVLAGGRIARTIASEKSIYADYDLFITTVNEELARTAIRNVYDTLVKHNHVQIWRSDKTITFYCTDGKHDMFEVQIIMKLHNSIVEVLSAFDLDSSAVAWDGNKLYCLPRFMRAYSLGYNLICPSRNSYNYGPRLRKYMGMGFRVAVVGIVDGIVVSPTSPEKTGLARTLYNINHSYYDGNDYRDDIVERSESVGINWSTHVEELNSYTNDILQLFVDRQLQTFIHKHAVDCAEKIELLRSRGIKSFMRRYKHINDLFDMKDGFTDDERTKMIEPSIPMEWSFWTHSFSKLNEPWFHDLYVY